MLRTDVYQSCVGERILKLTGKLQGAEKPVWASLSVPASPSQVRPRRGWALIKEWVEPLEMVELSGVQLEIARPHVRNSVFGRVLAINELDGVEIPVKVGELVVYQEWQGRRWDFNGEQALLMEVRHIVAKVNEHGDL